MRIDNIPAILWGEKADSIYVCVHGSMSRKEDAQGFAEKAVGKGHQVISFDLPEHGARKNENYPCIVCNGVHDLGIIGDYVQRNWDEIYLYGNSLGAYFSLLAYKDYNIKKCLFLSPLLDMERVIQNMMKGSNVNEQELKEKREIPTPMGETLYWECYCYAREHPVDKWDIPTAILYGSEDDRIEREGVEKFAKKFSCDLTVLEGGEHWFHTERQLFFLDKWLEEHI